jgi:pimeloyl-ACP methyl ester carboxylesterase
MAAAIRGARLVVVPRAGHLASLEQPEAVNSAISSFLVS